LLCQLLRKNDDMAHSKALAKALARSRATARVTNSPVISIKKLQNEVQYRPEFLQKSWSPTIRLIGGALGGWLGYQALRVKSPNRILLLGLSVSILTRVLSNRGFVSLLGALVNPVVRLRRTFTVSAPLEDVYEFSKDFRNYSRFMSYIQEVTVNQQGGLHWKAMGPGRSSIEWDAVLVAMIPYRMISWKSLPDALVVNEGTIRMKSVPNNGTLIDIELSYAPPVGALGYAAAHFMGFDPRSKIDQDLGVMRSLIESKSRP